MTIANKAWQILCMLASKGVGLLKDIFKFFKYITMFKIVFFAFIIIVVFYGALSIAVINSSNNIENRAYYALIETTVDKFVGKESDIYKYLKKYEKEQLVSQQSMYMLVQNNLSHDNALKEYAKFDTGITGDTLAENSFIINPNEQAILFKDIIEANTSNNNKIEIKNLYLDITNLLFSVENNEFDQNTSRALNCLQQICVKYSDKIQKMDNNTSHKLIFMPLYKTVLQIRLGTGDFDYDKTKLEMNNFKISVEKNDGWDINDSQQAFTKALNNTYHPIYTKTIKLATYLNNIILKTNVEPNLHWQPLP